MCMLYVCCMPYVHAIFCVLYGLGCGLCTIACWLVTTNCWTLACVCRQVLVKLNLMTVTLCVVMDRPYQFYHITPLLTFWFLVIYVFMATCPRVCQQSAYGESFLCDYTLTQTNTQCFDHTHKHWRHTQSLCSQNVGGGRFPSRWSSQTDDIAALHCLHRKPRFSCFTYTLFFVISENNKEICSWNLDTYGYTIAC